MSGSAPEPLREVVVDLRRWAQQQRRAGRQSHHFEALAIEAPTNVAWSLRNRSPMIRVPSRRGMGTRCEVRMPDPSANPYLSLTVQLAAGLDGVAQKFACREPVNRNIFRMSYRDRRKYQIDDLPRDLHEALDRFEKDDVIKAALGEHLTERFLEAKREEVDLYNREVTEWEIRSYLGRY